MERVSLPRRFARLRALLLAVCVAMTSAGLIPSIAGAVLVAVSPHVAHAYSASSSGGYTRPGGGFGGNSFSRRPDVGGSFGYHRPSTSGLSGGYSSLSAGDRAISRRNSGQAFEAYQSSRRPPAQPGAGSSAWGESWSRPALTPPAPGYPAVRDRQFGAWDGLFLWSLLASLSQPGNARFFYDNQNDPGYREWRADADRLARRDPQVAAELAKLDERLAQLQGQPRNPGASPPSASQQQAGAGTDDGNGGVVVIVIVVGVCLFVLLWVARRRKGAGGIASPGLSGSEQTRFRVGQTFPLDPAPFLLASRVSKVRPPPQTGGLISAEAVSVLDDRGVLLHRLYLPGPDMFFQVHLAEQGHADELRYFSKLDEITPATQAEWAFWLDPAQGMIGWPQFQTKDGKVYDRAWSPGATRVEPREQIETLQDLKGTSQRKLLSMLYAAPTGAPAPAAGTEYVLVSAVQVGVSAWIEVHAGIDFNPAALALPAVAL